MVGSIEDLVEEKAVQVAFDHSLVKWAQELGALTDEVSHRLELLEKEAGGFCFGGSKK
jgi:hypothetical protein